MTIRYVTCNHPGFRRVDFRPGFNLVLAEISRPLDAVDAPFDEKKTRNGVGKTFLLTIIDFCLGSTGGSSEHLKHPFVADLRFTIGIRILGKDLSVTRSMASPNVVEVQGDFTDWPIQPSWKDKQNCYELRLKEWRALLGLFLFGLPIEESPLKYTPTFRALLSFFLRLGKDAYTSPFETFRKMNAWQVQVYNSFLLGLDWAIPAEWQVVKEDLKRTDTIVKGLGGLLDDKFGSQGKLEAQTVQLQSQVKKTEAELAAFRVHDQYRDIETEANEITAKIQSLSNENAVDARLLEAYQASIQEETPADSAMVSRMYQQAGIDLGELVRRRLDEVVAFHTQVTRNRREYLEKEIRRLRTAISNRDRDTSHLDIDRARLLEILNSYGALEEYSALQARLSRLRGEFERVKTRSDELRELQEKQSELKLKQAELENAALADYRERRSVLDEAVELFNASAESLYSTAGSLVINVTPNGYRFDAIIEREGSEGIGNMKIFCYDLMLAQLWQAREIQPGFLCHDSTLFGDVDERQTASALRLAAQVADSTGLQYICCLNSDQVPDEELLHGWNLREHVAITLSDDREEDFLFGKEF